MKKIAYILVPAASLAIYLLNRKMNEFNEPEAVFRMLLNKGVNKELLKWAEKMYRLETNHFTSNIYRHTYGSGAIATSSSHPYGFRDTNKVQTTGLYHSPNGHSYIKFKTLLDGVLFLLYYLKRGNLYERVQKWGSKPGYLESVSLIRNEFVR